MSQSDNSEASLRPMQADDLEDLVALWIASWQETFPTIDFVARRGFITSWLKARGDETIVAEEGASLLGFCGREGSHLHQLVVAPAAKGKGVGRLLLDDAKARSPAGLTLDVNIANTRAVRFYRRERFEIVGEGTNPASGLATYAMRWSP